MRGMTLRKKLVLWYTLTFVILSLAFGGALLFLFGPVLNARTEELLMAGAEQILSETRIAQNQIHHRRPDDLASGLYYTIYDTKGQVAYAFHPETGIDHLELRRGKPYLLSYGGQQWMVYDRDIYASFPNDSQVAGALRIYAQTDALTNAARSLVYMVVALIPLTALVALLLGLHMARQALRPVKEITATAKAIAKGDVTMRLRFPYSGDEIGDLANTFDEMLDAIESSITREQQFTSDASHELRTPLSVILASCQCALDDRDTIPTPCVEALETIENRAKAMQATVSQLLLLSREHEQEKAMEWTDIDIAQMMGDILDEMGPLAEAKGISMGLEAEGPVMMRGDLPLLTRLGINLVDNAIKYGREGGSIRVTVRKEKDHLLLKVADNGVGIPQEAVPYIFDRFYRCDASRSTQGTGLGLSLVKWIAKLHRGQVSVESRVGEGTVFTARFPE